jgi:hypothetical protein
MSKHFYLRRPLQTLALGLPLFIWGASAIQFASAQNPQPESKPADNIHGVVLNSVTHEPISRALVSSPDNRFATMTNGEGRFEITFAEPENKTGTDESGSTGKISFQGNDRPFALTARKPGFLNDRNEIQNLPPDAATKENTILLTPEALIVGRVVLPTAEASDTIQLELYHRQVQEGRARWVPSGSASTRSNGEFRFAELAAGTYKLLTQELLDRDPLVFDPRGQLYGFPPVYFPNATDFSGAQTIQLAAGQIFQADITLVKHAYYPVKVAVANAPPGSGINIVVSVQGHKGPGFSLGYNNREQTIEGMLPDGNYTLEASSYGPNAASGMLNISVKGAALEGPRMTLSPNGSIGVNVKEEFTSSEDGRSTGSSVVYPDSSSFRVNSVNGRPLNPRGPRRYLNLRLESADDFAQKGDTWMRPPSEPDDSLAIDGVPPGRYWVKADSSRGFVASISSGMTDLQHQPLVVGLGGSSSPIEVTMRDAAAEIDGTIEGMAASFSGPEGPSVAQAEASSVHVYCVPLPDSSGAFKDLWVPANGKFGPQQLPPGTYRVLAFDRPQPELEYHNPEAMRPYEAKGLLVLVVPGQKEHVHLQLISTSE